MKKLIAVAAMAVTLCLAGLVMSGTAFAQQCVDNGNGTVTEVYGGYDLMWQKATAGKMVWDVAMRYASSLSLGGHSDWRLPKLHELRLLYHSPCKSMMEVVETGYWSSITDAHDAGRAWRVDFDDGNVFSLHKSSDRYVRAVRAGQ
ncbi:Lcl C-terminal domain-containing protein [Desulfonatronum thiodismutans]|uniref:Lcl C-terminal domain-containing protein n=1 Tax=Desulfonatronum thiodismutans TaxID=159290 RepID=UPI0004ABD662|nr:DUF1566 domain-containing protein [Desulfonatronum thiodismutans]